MKKNQKGYTVVEILLVTAILLLIAAFSIPHVYYSIRQAKDAAASATLHNIYSIYRTTQMLLSIDPALESPKIAEKPVPLHIPTRVHELPSEYATYVEAQIRHAFGGTPPQYEITEEAEDVLLISYWPEPEKDATLCYQWQNGTVYRCTIEQPEPYLLYNSAA